VLYHSQKGLRIVAVNKFEYYVVTLNRFAQNTIISDYITVKIKKGGRGACIAIHEKLERLGWEVRAIIPVLGFPKGGNRAIEIE
jgi:hypothetical protein